MGGFQLYQSPNEKLLKREEGGVVTYSINPGKFVRILEIHDVRKNKLETIISCTPEGDLKDRGKSDWIAKAIVILQTLWFVVQRIARGSQHLPLTELEIVTLAYAVMSLFIYMFWWDKPRDVGCPIRVYEKVTPNYTPAESGSAGFVGILGRVFTYIVGAQDESVLLSKQRKVPIFWSSMYNGVEVGEVPRIIDKAPAITVALLGPSIVGMAFGAIHFIAWWHAFPSHAVPLFSAISCGLYTSKLDTRAERALGALALILLVPTAWLYGRCSSGRNPSHSIHGPEILSS